MQKADSGSQDERSKRRYRKPVAWLLGRDLFASLTTTLLKSVVGSRMDVRDWMRPYPDDWFVKNRADKETEFWFDYLADTGDGYTATYSIAYLCMSDLEPSRGQANGYELPPGGTLPRGRFLFVGGDTSYHVADYNTLVARFQRPFNWAFADLSENHRQEGKKPPHKTRIYAIPGNHDYYSFLDGFGRQFRQPIPPGDDVRDLLDLQGFERCQESSYVALQLPFGWWFWGLDAQEGKLDTRQRYFLNELRKKEKIEKLIVATPEPSTKFGCYADPKSELVRSLEQIGLPCAFLEGQRDTVAPGTCRLDLSGDIHHYARYFGGDSDAGTDYASVVSGLGGAFLHPTYTQHGPIESRALYPKKWESQRAVVRAMLNPAWVAISGLVALFAGLVSLILYFAATVPMSSRSAVEALVRKLGLVLPPIPHDDNFWAIPGALKVDKIELQLPFFNELVVVGAYFVAVFALWAFARYVCSAACTASRTTRYPAHALTTLAAFAATVPVGLLLPLSWYLAQVDDPSQDEAIWLHPLTCTIVVAVFVVFGGICVGWMGTYTEMLFGLARDADRQRSIGAGTGSEKARGREPFWLDNVPWLFLLLAAIGNGALALWRYGSYELAIMFTDLVFLTVVVIVGLLIPIGAIVYGGEHLSWKRRALLGVLGLWFSLLQVAVPAGLIMYTPIVNALGVLILTGVLSYLVGLFAAELVTKESDSANQALRLGWMLLAVWIVLGVALLATIAPHVEKPIDVTGWNLLWVAIVGGGFGCIWLGWYLAVASLFGGHNNEVGGGSRIERYKQFIRFRLTATELTGYVIAIDDPQRDGPEAVKRCKVVDVFSIKPA